jgi:anti-sigma B factor antagonist
MAFQVSEREREGVVILDVSGRLTLGEGVAEVRERLQEVLDSGRLRTVLNLQGVTSIDSSGLGTLVMMEAKARQAGGELKLLNLNQRALELLVITKLNMVFDVFNDETSAVNSFFPDREIRKFDILDFLTRQKKK